MITLGFARIVLSWVLFFVLEGFDFGVGVLGPILGRDDHERGAIVATVGPFWDGNEVWLVAAIGVTFAAFPGWYAALLAGLYLPMAAVLLLLAVRGVALEFRGKGDGIRWRRRCDAALAASSAGIVLLWGAILAVFAQGLALGAAVLLGATFLALRTTGPVRRRARLASIAAALLLTATLGGTAYVTGVREIAAAAVLALGVALLARSGRETTAFTGTAIGVAAAVTAVLTVHGDVVLRSTLNPAWSLTMTGVAATGSTLRLLTVVGLIVLPGVLVYQAFSYWVFRRRVASERITS